MKILLNKQFIFLLLLMIPIHLTFDGSLNIYFDRTVHWKGGFQSVPVSIFFVLTIFLLNINKINFKFVLIISLLSIIYLTLSTIVIGWHWKLASIISQCLYFFITCEVIKSVYSQNNSRSINGFSLILVGISMLHFFYGFGSRFGIEVYDYDQYAAPFFSSMIIAFLIKNDINRLILIPAGIIFYYTCLIFLNEADSFYVELSIVSAILFYFLYVAMRNFKFTLLAQTQILFWFINISYLIFILSPYTEIFINHISISTRAEIFDRVFSNWDFFAGPFFSISVPWTFSSHSYLFEGLRVYSFIFIFINYFIIKKLINYDNEVGSIIALHAFIILGLFATPQFHFYTIPLIAVIPYLRWYKNN